MLSTDILLRLSHVNVFDDKFTDGDNNLLMAQNNSILDFRMGFSMKTRDNSIRCVTCGGNQMECPGHFGHIILNMPVYHPGYYVQISKILNILCPKCAKVNQDESSVCKYCGNNRITSTTIINDKKKQELRILMTPSDALELFNRVDDVEFNKLSEYIRRPNRLTDLILTTLAVPPSCIRPSVLQNRRNCISKLTKAIHQIQKTNIALIQKEGVELLSAWLQLQDEVTDYFGTKRPKQSFFALVKDAEETKFDLDVEDSDPVITKTKETGANVVSEKKKDIESIIERLRGKEGRFRGNLSGKRINFTGRSVISPDPNLKADEIGVPYAVSRMLTFPELVTHENKKAIQELIDNDQVEVHVSGGAYQNLQQQYSQKQHMFQSTFGQQNGPEHVISQQQENLQKDVFEYQYQYFEKEQLCQNGKKRVKFEFSKDNLFSKQTRLESQSNSCQNALFSFTHTNDPVWQKIYQFSAQKGCYDSCVNLVENNIDLLEQEKIYKYLEIPTSTLEKKDYMKGRELQPGDVVYRYLQDGDYLLFNRQPSLHKGSICKFKARIHPFKTFKFNVVNCANFGADFDGDEMNVHFPQLFEAVSDCESLLNHEDNLIDCATMNISMNIMQDSISGLYILSRESYFTFEQYCQYVMIDWQSINSSKTGYLGLPETNVNFVRNSQLDEFNKQKQWERSNQSKDFQDFFQNFYGTDGNIFHQSEHIQQPAILFPQQFYTGKQVISQYIANHTCGSPISYVDTKDKIFIMNSTFLSGILNKKHLGGIFSAVVANKINSYGRSIRVEQRALDLEFSLQRFALRYMQTYGFSIGIQDVWQSDDFLKKKLSYIVDCFKRLGYDDYSQIQQVWRYPEFIDKMNQSLESSKQQRIENKSILGDLSELRNKLSKDIINFIYYYTNINHNSTLVMSRSGSKGSIINQIQMTSLLSQQTISGTFVSNFFLDRVLPHFQANDQLHCPYQYGFIQNSFFTGLNPFEFLYHTASGREGVIDTAVKTARTGYIQRKLSKCLENVIVDWCGNTVENDNVIMINPYAGNDVIHVSYEQIKELYNEYQDLVGSCTLFDQNYVINRLFNLTLQEYLNQQYGFLQQEYMMQAEYHPQNSNITEDQFKDLICGLLAETYQQCKPQKEEVLHVLHFIQQKQFEEKSQLNNTLIPIKTIPIEFLRKLVVATRIVVNKFPMWMEANSPIGILSSQALGEPTTQMTLKTFHFAGLASKIQGVPRLTQIFNASQKTEADLVLLPARYSKSKSEGRDFGAYGDLLQATKKLQLNAKQSAQILGNKIDPLCLNEIATIKQIVTNQQLTIEVVLDQKELQHLCIAITPQQIQKYISDRFRLDKPGSGVSFQAINASTLQISVNADINELSLQFTQLFQDIQNLVVNGSDGCDVSIQEQKTADFLKSQYFRHRLENRHPLESEEDVAKEFAQEENLYFLTSTTPNHVLRLFNSPEIDPLSSYTRNIFDVQNIFGIEAARQSILDEVFTSYKDCGFAVSNYMVQIFASYMCNSGRILGYSDSGLRINKRGHTILLASFERTDQYLFDAAVKGNSQETIVDVSEDITFGNCIKLGSGGFQLFWEDAKETDGKHDV